MVEVVRRATEVAWVESADRVVVCRLDEPGADPLVLAGSAAVLWLALGDGLALDALVAEAAAAYDESLDVVGPGVRAWVDQAVESHIVDLASAE
ncbi:hypothetical protein [Nocardioides litoris]|uniref:hypothetical protein n=1 Tax=Nocardioides litoris TaxID=1926648 RepID=UPI0011200A4B|nr:hypothetical protein [Nocardioides litoris]